MNKIVVVADFGHFCAYTLSQTSMGTERLELIERFDSMEAHARFSETVSDGPGKFGQARGKNWSKGYGEPHNVKLEKEKRLIKNIAASINTIIAREENDGWYLAAQKTINGQIIDYLEPEVKARLEKNITVDLTKSDKSDILSKFK